MDVRIKINGQDLEANVPAETTLLSLLRENCNLTGAKLGCDVGDCGACTVLVDGRSINSCLMLAVQANGSEVTTIEGLGDYDHLHPLQAVFEQTSAFQCGFCAPGVIISSKELLDRIPHPTKHEIREALSGNLCRCTGYTKIVEAILHITSLPDDDRESA